MLPFYPMQSTRNLRCRGMEGLKKSGKCWACRALKKRPSLGPVPGALKECRSTPVRRAVLGCAFLQDGQGARHPRSIPRLALRCRLRLERVEGRSCCPRSFENLLHELRSHGRSPVRGVQGDVVGIGQHLGGGRLHHWRQNDASILHMAVEERPGGKSQAGANLKRVRISSGMTTCPLLESVVVML